MNRTGIGNDVYRVAARCSNCGHQGSVSRPKGTEMPRETTCPNCGCSTFMPLGGSYDTSPRFKQ